MNLQTMAPSAKRSLLITLVFSAVAAGLYFGAIEMTETKLFRARASLRQTTERHRTLSANLARGNQTKERLGAAEAALDEFRQAMIEPLLESTAMRAKSLVDRLAAGCGLSGMEYETLPAIDLPTIGTPPARRHVRCPIRITCVGSYQAAVSFVRCVEARFPLTALESLVVAARNDPDAQQVTIVLEWPMEQKGGSAK